MVGEGGEANVWGRGWGYQRVLVYLRETGRCTEQHVSFCMCVYMSLCVVCATVLWEVPSIPFNHHSITTLYIHTEIWTQEHIHTCNCPHKQTCIHTYIYPHIPPVTPPIAHAHHTCTHKVPATQKDTQTCTASRDCCTCTIDSWWLLHTWVSRKVAPTQVLQGQSEGVLSAKELCRCFES